MRGRRSWTLQEPPIERPEYQDNSDVYYQPLPEVVPEEQDVHADHDGYQREHVKRDCCLSSHRFVLLCATEWSKSGAGFPAFIRLGHTAPGLLILVGLRGGRGGGFGHIPPLLPVT